MATDRHYLPLQNLAVLAVIVALLTLQIWWLLK